VVDIERFSGFGADDWEWQKNAACRGMGDSTFFHPPDERDPARSARIAQAKRICHSCPCITECRAHALRVREPYGIWGGLSEEERATLLGVRSMRYPGLARRPTVTFVVTGRSDQPRDRTRTN
jgi:WhiB family redox-sensing transcriptional regulator